MIPRKTFQNLSPEKQERITRIAVEEFGNKGFEGASINAMVGRMNIAKGSIFQYFGDKKGLFLFVFYRSVEMVKSYLRTVRDQSADDDLATRLNKTLNAGILFIQKHPLLYRLYMKVLFESKIPFRDDILMSLRHHSIDYLKSLLEAARLKNELSPDIDTDKAAFVIDAVMDRFLSAHAVRHLDSGLGIYNAPADLVNAWITDISDMICLGIVTSARTTQKNDGRQNPSPYILIAAAVKDEIWGLINKMIRPTYLLLGTRRVISGSITGKRVKLLVSGPGMVNAAQAITAAVENEKPALIIQTGCAGVFRQSGLAIGDIAVATEEIDVHTGLEPNSGSDIIEELPFALIDGDHIIKNRYPVHTKLTDCVFQAWQSSDLSSKFKIAKGPFITVSTVTTSDDRAIALFQKFAPCMEQMEGAAAAHTAILYHVPFIEIRSACNYVGSRNRESWNPELAFKNSCEAVYQFIQIFNLNTLNH